VLALVAVRHGLDCRRDFKDVLVAAADAFGLHQLADELRGNAERTERPLPPMPEPEPEREYPPQAEVDAVWNAAVPVERDERSMVMLALRGLRPGLELARAVSGALPRWASFQGQSWASTGHRVIVPAYDAQGAMRSLRAWQTNTRADGPKRLPPGGYRASGLVLANDAGLRCLREPSAPVRVLIVEGEPDLLAAAQAYPGTAVLGVISGSWSEDFAARIPLGSEVAIHTHHDLAGQKYAEHIKSTLAKRAVIVRSKS
jgi:hypothetical protein